MLYEPFTQCARESTRPSQTEQNSPSVCAARRRPARRAARRRDGMPLVPKATIPCGEPGVSRRKAVSYTHLRAHETLMNL
eukprot:7285401-Prymnesium_polylepis.1